MTNRAIAILLMLLACVPVVLRRATSLELLKDSDTNFLIFKLNEYNNPLRWFTHDWPLENHFYRPISTLVFEADNRLHPGNSQAFGLTNALICVACILATAWFATEVKRSLLAGVVAAWLASMWTLGGWFFGTWWQILANYIPFLILFLTVVRGVQERRVRWTSIVTALGSFFVFASLSNVGTNLSAHTMYWIPGRTATVMTLFAMVSMAAYVRFERLGASQSAAPPPTSLDEPATRTSTQNSGTSRTGWGWFALSCVSCVLALGSYEQAVMMPFVIFLLGVILRTQRTQTRFAFQLAFWMILLGYILIRLQFIPLGPSKYQAQQFRSGPGLWLDLFNYLFPSLMDLRTSWTAITTGFILIISGTFWGPMFAFVGNVSAWVSLRKSWIVCALPLVMATLAYLPMSFLSQFGHYHYWPAMILTTFVIGLFESYWPLIVSAVSPRVVQAPQRSDRAPGSLPRL